MRAVPCNALGGKRIFTMAAGIKIWKVNGQYQYQPPSLKFTCTWVLDQNFLHPKGSRLYLNIQACWDNLIDDSTNTSDEETVDVKNGEGKEAQVPDHILMDVPFLPEQVPEEPAQPPPVPLEVQVDQIPFPPTPDPEVPEPGPVIKPHSYQSVKDSEYFRSSMV